MTIGLHRLFVFSGLFYFLFSLACQKICSKWARKNSFLRNGQCFDNEKRMCNNSVLREFDKEEYREIRQGKERKILYKCL